jgi:putative oxidoreductase
MTQTQTQARSEASGVSSSTDLLALVAGVLLSAIFLISGLGKVAAPAQTIGFIASAGLPLAKVAYALTVAVELGAGLALLLGFRARIAALLLAGFTLAAAAVFHHNFADQNQFLHFFKNIAMTGGLLQVAAFGRGRFSLDARRR